jgi:NADH-quinone oxidoreductase subunit N
MILGGAGAALEKNLGRTMGYAIIHHIGVSLLGISLIEYSRNYLPNSVPFFYFFIPWGISLGLLALSINILHKKHDYVEISDLNGIIRRSPWISAGILISIFSMGGLPLLAGFPAYIGIWSPLVQRDPRLALVAWLGNALIILTGLNLFSIMIRTSNPQENWRISESVVQISILTAGILVILILGLLPTGPFIVWANHAAMLMFSAP